MCCAIDTAVVRGNHLIICTYRLYTWYYFTAPWQRIYILKCILMEISDRSAIDENILEECTIGCCTCIVNLISVLVAILCGDNDMVFILIGAIGCDVLFCTRLDCHFRHVLSLCKLECIFRLIGVEIHCHAFYL